MTQKIQIAGLTCTCATARNPHKIAYILYPLANLSAWIEPAARKHNITIVVITGMDWQNTMTPWPAPAITKNTPDFRGQAPTFLKLLQEQLIPQIEATLQIAPNPERTLIGISLSGLFALWQWIICDTFHNIASISGSFWYDHFLPWLNTQTLPDKTGRAIFLLGTKEPHSPVKTFATIGTNTLSIIQTLNTHQITATFQWVPGNHFSSPIARLDTALTLLH